MRHDLNDELHPSACMMCLLQRVTNGNKSIPCFEDGSQLLQYYWCKNRCITFTSISKTHLFSMYPLSIFKMASQGHLIVFRIRPSLS